ncbi:MAG: hypothetical protein GDA56_32480 [Hormoscilla sp. GM7CHS1pb]|nr:hypothetical protein [Hormoscilla sp. GM7CHS1pb]
MINPSIEKLLLDRLNSPEFLFFRNGTTAASVRYGAIFSYEKANWRAR